METVTAGKPIVATPFFGDQPENANLAVRAGIAALLPPARFKAAKVQAAVDKVLNDPKYTAAALEAQRALLSTGGATRCCEVVEDIAMYGSKHLASSAPPLVTP